MTRRNISCCHALMYVTCQPCAALASHVERLWYCDGHAGIHGKERVLPDGRFQLAFSLAEGPISALADPMSGRDEIAPSLLLGIRSRFSMIDTAKLRSAMGVVFRPGGARVFLNSPADAFHNKDVSLDLIWGSMVRTLRDWLLTATRPAEKFKLLEAVLLERLNERAQLNAVVQYALKEFARRSEMPRVQEIAQEGGLSRRRFAHLFREHRDAAKALLPSATLSKCLEADCIWRSCGVGAGSPGGGLLRSGTFCSRIPGFLRSFANCISGGRPSRPGARFDRLNQPFD
ncbi:MAG TPA: DUF6597 domain-containing transcriptional factor [Pyrinomonadaceae bacterium]|nr:DUF6597 domain-containing transcriptional factor [Pyrinomonadaceae bacterium]